MKQSYMSTYSGQFPHKAWVDILTTIHFLETRSHTSKGFIVPSESLFSDRQKSFLNIVNNCFHYEGHTIQTIRVDNTRENLLEDLIRQSFNQDFTGLCSRGPRAPRPKILDKGVSFFSRVFRIFYGAKHSLMVIGFVTVSLAQQNKI